MDASAKSSLGEIALLFLRLGATSFGGPAAHIARIYEEVVRRRRWIDEQHFLDLLGASNLIPGPSSTEMAIHIGYVRGGWAGLLVAGVSFILPALLIVIVLAMVYVRYNTMPQVGWLLYGIKPVVIAIICKALWDLGRKAVRGWFGAMAAAVAVAIYLMGGEEIPIMLGCGVVFLVFKVLKTPGAVPPRLPAMLLAPAGWVLGGFAAAVPFSLSTLFLSFLKIGAIIYGSGYVLLAFLQTEFVERLGWISQQQLIDAIAVGQLTPGPVFTTSAFIGYLLGATPGALVASLGIFLPSFVLVAISNPLIPRMRRSVWVSGLLDGVNIASLALMGGVTFELGQSALVDPLTFILAGAALLALILTGVNSTWLLLAGGIIGLVQRVA